MANRVNLLPEKKEMTRRTSILSLVVAFLAIFGCASGWSTNASGSDKQNASAAIHCEAAEKFLAAGDYDDAISEFNTATSLEPGLLAAWSGLGRTYFKIRDFPGGIDAYQKALALSPDNAEFLSALGHAYLETDNLQKAEECYLKLVEKDSLSYDGHVNLGAIYLKKNDSEWATEHYESAVAIRPDDAASLGILASLYDRNGDEEKRMIYLRRASEAAPDNVKFKTLLGSLYMKKKDFENARLIFEDLVKRFPDEAAYHQNLGIVLSQMPDRRDQAPAELEKTLELKGSDPHVCAILSLVYNELEQYEKAIAAAKRGVEGNSGEQAPLLYYQWGVALSKLENFSESIAMFEKVVASGDAQWIEAAKKQIERQARLEKIAEQQKQRK
jgi:tetratricopeptide (TPR) repeat protein